VVAVAAVLIEDRLRSEFGIEQSMLDKIFGSECYCAQWVKVMPHRRALAARS